MKTNNSSNRNLSTAFTLVEIMIVVLIIGILLAIAIPNFIQAREASRAKSCVANLKQIDSGKQQCAMDNKIAATATDTFVFDGTTPSSSGVWQLVDKTGASGYLRSVPSCPSAGTYAAGTIGATPTCTISVGATAGSGYAAGERFYHGL